MSLDLLQHVELNPNHCDALYAIYDCGSLTLNAGWYRSTSGQKIGGGTIANLRRDGFVSVDHKTASLTKEGAKLALHLSAARALTLTPGQTEDAAK